MIAVFTADELLRRMLELEIERSGHTLVPPAKARLFLLDLDHPVNLPEGLKRPFTVGFCSDAPHNARGRADLLLPLPYPTRALQEILHRYGGYAEERGHIEPLPGGALLGGKRISLSPLEERLFLCLYERRGEIVPTESLLAALGDGGTASNVLQVLLSRLRKKLAPDGISRIRAMRGKGYMMIDETR